MVGHGWGLVALFCSVNAMGWLVVCNADVCVIWFFSFCVVVGTIEMFLGTVVVDVGSFGLSWNGIHAYTPDPPEAKMMPGFDELNWSVVCPSLSA